MAMNGFKKWITIAALALRRNRHVRRQSNRLAKTLERESEKGIQWRSVERFHSAEESDGRVEPPPYESIAIP